MTNYNIYSYFQPKRDNADTWKALSSCYDNWKYHTNSSILSKSAASKIPVQAKSMWNVHCSFENNWSQNADIQVSLEMSMHVASVN